MLRLTVKFFEPSDIAGYKSMTELEYGKSHLSDDVHVQWKHLSSCFGPSDYIRLDTSSNSVVGRAMIQSRILKTDGKDIRCGQVMDLLINQDFRKTPLNFIRLTKACDTFEKYDLIFHTSNEKSFPLYHNLLKFSSPFKLSGYGFPVRLSKVIAKVTGIKRPIPEFFSTPLMCVIKALSKFTNLFAGLEVSSRSISESELDELVRKILVNKEFLLYRSKEFLDWRFKCSGIWKGDIYRLDSNGVFVGYVVVRKIELDGISHFVLMDVMISSSASWLVKLNLKLILIKMAFNSGADTFFTLLNSNSSIAKRVIGFPFFKIPDSSLPHSTPIFIRALNQDCKWITEIKSIHLTLADLDYF
jgi:hypothetical protein